MDIDGATFDGVPLTTTDGTLTTLDNVVFQNMDPAATQLTVFHDGVGGPFTFDDVIFDPLTGGDTGFYIRANDSGGADDVVINMVFDPGNGPAFTLAEDGAVVNWN